MKKHYDICIAGFWYGWNYGSLLNGYAEYRILKDIGKEVLMLQKPGAKKGDLEITEGHNVRFVSKYYDEEDISPALPYHRLSELNEICDCFCAGSDQIWNYDLSFHENLYLPFVNDDKKIISFATSFGSKKDNTPKEARFRIKRYLERYSAISVREQFDVDILRENYGLIGNLVFEPVFCIDKSYYTIMAEDSKFNEVEPYLLTYILDPTPEIRQAILYYGQKFGCKIVNILDGNETRWDRIKKILDLPNVISNVGVEDFIKAFMNAKYVITDSFHGSAFSIIFNKPFLAIGNYNRGYERFVDLLGRLKLKERLITNPKNIPFDEKYLEPVDYTDVNEIIKKEVQKTLEWFRDALDTPKEKFPSILTCERAVTSMLDKKLCMGCGACVSVCPTGALSFRQDEVGYYRSAIDYTKCINCGKCSEVCPALKLPQNNNTKEPVCYEFIAADKEVLYRSSSGGIFPLLARLAFQKKGVVVGAAWRDDFAVEHIIIESEEDLPRLQKSKYLQSYLGDTCKKVKEKLEEGIFVLFSGCPCQVAGLKGYLKKDYDNLIAIDLLCGNSPSTMFFQNYLKSEFPTGIKKYEFRHKKEGWNWDCVTLTLTDGTTVVRRGGIEDSYQRVYHNHTMCSYHCENCIYQKAPRFGDITIGDFWGIENKDISLDTHQGVSVVLCNNQKGHVFLESIPEESIGVKKEVPLAWLGGNGYVINNSHNYCSPKRDIFYAAVTRMPFKEAVNYALKPNHGRYNRETLELAFLSYDTQALHFKFDTDIWEEHFIMGKTVLTVKEGKTIPGRYAVLPLNGCLKEKTIYVFAIRFRVKTDSSYLNFHIKDSGSNYYQIIYSYRVPAKKNKDWVELRKEFSAKSDIFDEFMVGASQLTGEERYLEIDYIHIFEKGAGQK